MGLAAKVSLYRLPTYDPNKPKRYYSPNPKSAEIIFQANIIFVNASALNSNLILLNSRSNRYPNGLGNDHDLLGRYIGFHNYRASAGGKISGFEDKYYYGSRPSECIIANYRNLKQRNTDFLGGYTIFTGAFRNRAEKVAEDIAQLGADFKHNLSKPGDWQIYMYMQGETLPKASNRVYLSPDKTDDWGIPLLVTDVDYDENDEKMTQDFLVESNRMLTKMGCTDIEVHDNKQAPGLDIHEMGGARMGKDPKTSLLNEYNQMHGCKNVFVTDGACMTSMGNQSPSILYMALTARAATYAATQFKKGLL